MTQKTGHKPARLDHGAGESEVLVRFQSERATPKILEDGLVRRSK